MAPSRWPATCCSRGGASAGVERRRTADYFDASEMLADLPPAMADRLLRRIAAAKPEEMQREAE